ncbi:uncharacterized protein si:ch211-176l24.4 [Synchiropus splendidus]|uniref:uncharacterized protein si:ch211-176l24.4 n=1 Tax=Synchiropus splendidus TaxID=270530 RepID=UPI00237D954A|nr:uncharacterized protein si:ch211-176l24.4 [Synchiropus splendidus]
MQRPGSDDTAPTHDSDQATKAFWKALIPAKKQKKASKKDRKDKTTVEAKPKKKSAKEKKGKKEKKKKKEKLDSNVSAKCAPPAQSHMTQESPARKKRVAFHLMPLYTYKRHPELAAPSSVQPGDSDSPPDIVGSQDLFITQNHFRASPSDPSSEELRTPPQSRMVRAKVRCTSKSPHRAPQRSSTATQTENFFTSELSSLLHFQQSAGSSAGDTQPLDLSLPHRCRAGGGMPEGGQRSGAMSDEDSTPSNGSQLEAKSVNTVTSSDESDRVGRADLAQVRAVQMRLNESFFFKTKGDTQPPRPESPLMKLSQGRDGKKPKKKLKGSKTT